MILLVALQWFLCDIIGGFAVVFVFYYWWLCSGFCVIFLVDLQLFLCFIIGGFAVVFV